MENVKYIAPSDKALDLRYRLARLKALLEEAEKFRASVTFHDESQDVQDQIGAMLLQAHSMTTNLLASVPPPRTKKA